MNVSVPARARRGQVEMSAENRRPMSIPTDFRKKIERGLDMVDRLLT
jgi:hypothetical protein